MISKRSKREIEFLRSHSHPSIVKLHHVVTLDSGQQCVVLELLEKRLDQHIKECCRDPFLPEFAGLFYQVLEGLVFLHGKGYTHRDLKPDNLMVLDKHAKIVDFGFVRNLESSEPITQVVVGLPYRAPELLLNNREYDSGVDVWALACVIYLCAEGELPFRSNSEFELIHSIFSALNPSFRMLNILFSKFKIRPRKDTRRVLEFRNSPPSLRSLLSSMFQIDPRDRISAAQALDHEYFDCVRKTFATLKINIKIKKPREQVQT